MQYVLLYSFYNYLVTFMCIYIVSYRLYYINDILNRIMYYIAWVQLQQPGIQPEEMDSVGDDDVASDS